MPHHAVIAEYRKRSPALRVSCGICAERPSWDPRLDPSSGKKLHACASGSLNITRTAAPKLHSGLSCPSEQRTGVSPPQQSFVAAPAISPLCRTRDYVSRRHRHRLVRVLSRKLAAIY
jgi:hypothetical protein